MTPLLWSLIALQIVMGTFDTFYHHEFTERLAWRPSQRYELKLHGVRNMLYALLFLVLGWLEVHGVLAMLVIPVLAVEVVITLMDFVEEDMSRKLPASERINHTLLAINYGAILILLLPVLGEWATRPTGVAPRLQLHPAPAVTVAPARVAPPRHRLDSPVRAVLVRRPRDPARHARSGCVPDPTPHPRSREPTSTSCGHRDRIRRHCHDGGLRPGDPAPAHAQLRRLLHQRQLRARELQPRHRNHGELDPVSETH